MSAVGQYVSKLRLERAILPESIQRSMGISIQRQTQIEQASALPSYQERRAYAQFFGFDDVQAFDDGWRGSVIALSRGELSGRIPVINLVPAGQPEDYVEMYPDSGIGSAYIDPPPGIAGPNLFAFVIAGDSMAPTYPAGHFAICRPELPGKINDGAAVFVRFGAQRDHVCTFKRCFRVAAATVDLRPINPRYSSLSVSTDEIVRMAPVIAVVAPGKAYACFPGETRRIVAEDVQTAPEEER
jgi:SOS-response transcriptional repressor LexA